MSARNPSPDGDLATARSARSIAAGTLFELSAANARVARPTSSSALPPKCVAEPKRAREVAQPAIIEPTTMKEAAALKPRGWFIDLPPTFCLCGPPVEAGHA